MKVNIYYGGRGVLDDPTIYVISKMEQALIELRVDVNCFNIYENKNAISTLPQTFKDADAIILATTVEWLGIGGYMNQFLDACWLYGDKEKIASIYMQPVVMSTTYGEREALLTLENAWEILGGQLCSGLCGYVDQPSSFEKNKEYAHIIEKKAENLYRTISQKAKGLPTSNQAVTQSVLRTQNLNLTPQESEQLSRYAADDGYVKQQKEDIIELSSKFRNLMGENKEDEATEFIVCFQKTFIAQDKERVVYRFEIEEKDKPLIVLIDGNHIICKYGMAEDDEDVLAKLSRAVMNEIVAGRMTFQRAFSVGDMAARGNFGLIRMLDSYFPFQKE